MMTFPARLNCRRWILRRQGGPSSTQPQQVARSRSSTDGRCHNRGPLPLMPARAKSDPGLNMPTMRSRYKVDLLMRSWLQASAVVAQ